MQQCTPRFFCVIEHLLKLFYCFVWSITKKYLPLQQILKMLQQKDMEKKKVSQDFLYQFILERGVNVSVLADLMGMSATMVNGCFRHNKDKDGNARNFPERTLPKLNAALVAFAEELNNRKIRFGSDKVYASSRGTTYDPAVVDEVKNLLPYLKIKQFLHHSLGWSIPKTRAVIHSPTSKGYGLVTESDVNAINAAITEIVIVLDSIEVVPDSSEISDGD